MKAKKIQLEDHGRPEYLDGCMAQFSIKDSNDGIVAYVFHREAADKIVRLWNKEEYNESQSKF